MWHLVKLATGAVTAALLVATTPAYAGLPLDRMTVPNPDDWTPIVEDGVGAFGVATVGDVTVVGGSFTRVHARGGATVTRNNIFAFDSTGAISDTFVPTIATRVWDVIPAGDGQTVYLGGQFTNVNGLGRTTRVARINVNTGQVVTTFKPPNIDGKVTDLQLANGRLYVGGYFKNVGGQPQTGLVALNPTTGAVTTHLNLTFADIFRDSTTPKIPSGNSGVGVEKFAISDDGSRLVAIGNFRTVAGQPRVQVAVIDISGETAVLTSWATSRYSMACSANFPTYTLGVDIDPTGTYFVIGAGAAYNGGVTSGTLCDTVARWELGATGPNQQPTWVDYIGGDSTNAVHVTRAAVYIGGHFRWVNDPFAGDRAGPGSVGRKGMAALDPRNGLPFMWNASKLPLNWGVMRFVSTDAGLWIAHDGDYVADEPAGRIAFLPVANGKVLPKDNTGSLPGTAYLLTPGTGQLVSSSLTETSAAPFVTGNGGGIDWSTLRGAFMTDGRLYSAWANGTFTWRPFNGTTFGTVRTIDLHDLTAFASELSAIRAMWFDAATGRLYFTLAGQSQLYYRYFTPESTVVGAVRFTAADTGAGISWANVTGAFLANNKLYYSSSDGSLRSVGWQSGAVPGTVTSVSGPAVDGLNWGSGALFLRAP